MCECIECNRRKAIYCLECVEDIKFGYAEYLQERRAEYSEQVEKARIKKKYNKLLTSGEGACRL